MENNNTTSIAKVKIIILILSIQIANAAKRGRTAIPVTMRQRKGMLIAPHPLTQKKESTGQASRKCRQAAQREPLQQANP